MSQPPSAPELNPKAMWSLVLAAIGLFCGFISLVAIVLARQARLEIEASNGTQSGIDHARIGFVLGVLGAVLWAGYIVYRLVF